MLCNKELNTSWQHALQVATVDNAHLTSESALCLSDTNQQQLLHAFHILLSINFQSFKN